MILVAGSANLDFVVRVPHIPAPGETLLGHDFQTYPGGKGANQAVAAARAGGVATAMLLSLGKDSYGAQLQAALKQDHITLHCVAASCNSGSAFISVSDDAENAITVVPGANHYLRPEHWEKVRASGAQFLLLQLEIPMDCVLAYAQAAHAEGMTVVLNAAPAQTLPPALLAVIDVLIVNQGELNAITGQPAKSIQAQLDTLPCPWVIVTLGARGTCVRVREDHARPRYFYQPAFAVSPLDTTGAGDTFCGALIAACATYPLKPLNKAELDPNTWAKVLGYACAASALACTKMGAQSSIPDRPTVQAFLHAQGPHSPEQVALLKAYCTAFPS